MTTTLEITTRETLCRRDTSTSLPSLVACAGERAATRFLEFFTVNIRNRNTREAYGRAAFLERCHRRGLLDLAAVKPTFTLRPTSSTYSAAAPLLERNAPG